jgi:hypothetical protein
MKMSILITGSIKEILDTANSQQLSKLIKSKIAGTLQNFEKSEIIQYKIGKRKFDFKLAYVMGIR